MRHLRRLPLLVPIAILLTACATVGDDTPTPVAPSSLEPTATPVVPASVACLESGTWLVDPEHDAEGFTEVLESIASDVQVARTGQAAYVFEDGQLTRTYSQWSLSFSAVLIAMGNVPVTETTTLDGANVTTYEATEDRIDVAPADVSGLTADTVATENGAPRTFEDPGSGVLESAGAEQSWAFVCDEDTLELGTATEDGTLPSSNRIVLHRG